MGVINQGAYGSFKGKVGNLVGRIRGGVNVLAIYQPEVKNPKTRSQTEHRRAFGVLSSMGAALGRGLAFGFSKIKVGGQTNYNAFFKANWPAAVDVQTGVIQYANLLVGKGNIEGVDGGNAVDNGNGEIEVTWSNNSDPYLSNVDDELIFAIVDADKNEARVINTTKKRAAGAWTFQTPTAWSSDTAHVYTFFTRPSDGKASNSQYLGSVVLS